MAEPEDQLMDLLFRAFIVCEQPTPDDKMFAACAACTGSYRWCARADISEVKDLADKHIRDEHRIVAVLTIDAMRGRYGKPTDEIKRLRHRLTRLRLGVMVIRDQLATINRTQLVLNPVAVHAHVLGVGAAARTLLEADRLLRSGELPSLAKESVDAA